MQICLWNYFLQFVSFSDFSENIVDLHRIFENILTSKGQYYVPVFHLEVYVQVVEVEDQ